MAESKEIQTEPFILPEPSSDKTLDVQNAIATEVPKSASVLVQTELTTKNIEEVDEIQIVREMHSQPTQTDPMELSNMEPIFIRSILSSPLSTTMKSPDANFDVDSNISSCSKSEEITRTASAGLDM